MPKIPLDYKPSERGRVALNLALFVLNGCLAPLPQASLAFSTLWQTGYLSMITLPVRFAMEASGGVAYAAWVWRQMEATGDITKGGERVARLTLGSRSPVELPWGGPATLLSINVMDFIDKMDASGMPGARADYEFLCESCHPSFLQLTYWNLASISVAESINPVLKKRMVAQFDRTISLLEDTVAFARSRSNGLLDTILPIVEQERAVHEAT
ncbi:MAG: hypothetical protein RBR35_09440 [Salinivirgaceae bacterium]|jgi:hypothetical protein|nr:hypothetical protein [Salinivirgaceae bacterium]